VSQPASIQFRVIGMDSADDAAHVENAVRKVQSAETARVSAASQLLTLPDQVDPQVVESIRAVVADLGYRLEPADAPTPSKPPHLLPSYRRALWIVVALNLGYGIIEAVGGFLAGSQALKADALDFVGDGLITILGLVAIRRSPAWRARTAMLQGGFLALLGLGVLSNTVYRALVHEMPNSEAMGVLAAFALIVNLVSAAVLVPHRSGDANVRAVWLFSRNDAVGNLLVLVAAGLVAVTGTPWPDVLVGAVVAALFLQSSLVIMRSAKRDLAESSSRSA
jgi:Co/Zn/Cd efflux system component/copper chaperone CopZ